MSAPASWANAYPGPAMAAKRYKTALDFGENARCVSSGELLAFNSRWNGVVQAFPNGYKSKAIGFEPRTKFWHNQKARQHG